MAYAAGFHLHAHVLWLKRGERGRDSLVLERRVPPDANEAGPLDHFAGGKIVCIFCASMTFPVTLSMPFMNAIVPESLPLTILT